LDTTSRQKRTARRAGGSNNNRQSGQTGTDDVEEDEDAQIITQQYTDELVNDDDDGASRPAYSDNDDNNDDDDEGEKDNDDNDDDRNDDDDDTEDDANDNNKKPRAVTKSTRQPLRQIDRESREAPRAFPGTLLYLSEQAKGDDSVNGMAAATHINKWTAILGHANTEFERALHKESRRLTRHPIAFAFLEPASNKVQLLHGIEEIAMDNEEHDAEGRIGFFIGDRVTVTIDGVVHQQDPQFGTVATFPALTDKFQGKPATAMACIQAVEPMIAEDTKARTIHVAKLFSVPVVWWSFFLAKPRTPTETYRWIAATTRSWKSDAAKTAANTARQWSRVACTHSLTSRTTSGIALPVGPGPRDMQTVQWASHSLNRYLPRPKPSPSTQPQPVAPAPPNTNHQHATLHQAMLLAQDVITKTFKRSDREKTVAKRLPEATLCRLLGLSGLGWDDQALLAPVWLKLYQQQDKASREMVLRAFFQELGKTVPAFTHFRNSTLFDNIIAQKFEPGASYESCHHGISLLAVSMRSFAAQERERQDDDHFEQATSKTPEAVRKHSAKTPPPLPTTIAELQQLMWRLVVLTKGLFTTNCLLAIQLQDLFTAVQEWEQTLMGDLAAVDELIPQLAWAVTAAAREFYGTINTRGDVDPPEDEYGTTAPTVAIAQLSIHTTMFKAGYRLNLTNIPEQWKRHPPSAAPATQQRSDGSNNNNNRNGKGGGGSGGQ
jgi:hypothetical protein